MSISFHKYYQFVCKCFEKYVEYKFDQKAMKYSHHTDSASYPDGDIEMEHLYDDNPDELSDIHLHQSTKQLL